MFSHINYAKKINSKLVVKWLFYHLLLLVLLFSSANAVVSDDNDFLELIERQTFNYFWEMANPENGLIADATGNPNASNSVIGFGLASLCIAAERGWIPKEDVKGRVLRTLRSFASDKPGQNNICVEKVNGFHYHWVDIKTGKWCGVEGIFMSDTMALLGGVLVCRQYFKGTEIEDLATKIYYDMQWEWFTKSDRLQVGWIPQTGFTGPYLFTPTSLLAYLLAIGSPTHPISSAGWFSTARSFYWANYKGISFAGDGALYTHQWSQIFFDARFKKDRFADYFLNSTYATLANRQYCIDKDDGMYNEFVWGLTPCIGPNKYGEYAAPELSDSPVSYKGIGNDGTVAPTASGSSIVFTPSFSIATMKYYYDNFRDKLWGKYGFTDSFNLKQNWWCKEYLGIDQGPLLLMIENYRTGFVWHYFMLNPEIKQAMRKMGFRGIIDDFEQLPEGYLYSNWNCSNKSDRLEFTEQDTKMGKRALKIVSADSKCTLTATPMINDFSIYEAVSFWIKGARETSLVLLTENGESISLGKQLIENSDTWTHILFPLQHTQESSFENVKQIQFCLMPIKNKKEIFLDEVLLTLTKDTIPPERVNNIKAEQGKYVGEVKLIWTAPSDNNPDFPQAFSYSIKYSKNPINSRDDFLEAKSVEQCCEPAPANSTESFLVTQLEPGIKYYFALASEDLASNVSEISNIASAFSGTEVLNNLIDDFEDGNFTIPTSWSARPEYTLKITDKITHTGKYALEVSFNKPIGTEWSCFEASPPFPNLSHFRYLNLWIYGSAELLAKIYNTDDRQEDISIQRANNPQGWTKLTFNLSTLRNVDLRNVNKLIFFIQPGREASGRIVIDDVELCN